jgi:hypothetical protein
MIMPFLVEEFGGRVAGRRCDFLVTKASGRISEADKKLANCKAATLQTPIPTTTHRLLREREPHPDGPARELGEQQTMTATCLTRKALVFLLVLGLPVPPIRARGNHPTGYLALACPLSDGKTPCPKQPYHPQPGDLIFFTNSSVLFNVLYVLALTGAPHHVGMVVLLPDGTPTIAEAGAWNLSEVKLIGLAGRMRTHDGEVHVRRLRSPLTVEQSRCLTRYALAQTNKPYAYVRTVLEASVTRSHGFIGAHLFGSPCVDRPSWNCCDLTIACAAIAGLLDPNEVMPNTVYVRDLYRNHPEVFGVIWEEPEMWWATEE